MSMKGIRQRTGRVGEELAAAARWLSNMHRPNGLPNACIVSAPRSGSTWLLELVLTQPGFKPCNEPFNLRKPAVARRLGLDDWAKLNDSVHLPQMKAYLDAFLENRYSGAFKGLRPGLPYYRFVTNRIAFKILFACEHRLDWLAQTLRARLVLLIRHPLPVALSRQDLPRLEAFITSEYRKSLSAHQIRLAEETVRRGDPLEKAVLDWCLQYAVPLERFRNDFLLLTYEQLVLRPEPALDALATHLVLDDVDRMRTRVDHPSASVSKSSAETVGFLQERKNNEDRQWLIDKWRPRIPQAREESLMRLVNDFGIDIYRSGESVPSDAYWI
jgi:hypothetical protein